MLNVDRLTRRQRPALPAPQAQRRGWRRLAQPVPRRRLRRRRLRRRRLGDARLAGAAAADGAPSFSVSTTCPIVTLSPLLTLISETVPATDDGTSIVALSVSSSRTP